MDIIIVVIVFCFWVMLDELKYLGLWIMIVSLWQLGENIFILMIVRLFLDMDSKYFEKKFKYCFSFCNLVYFVINKIWECEEFFVFIFQCFSYFVFFFIIVMKI